MSKMKTKEDMRAEYINAVSNVDSIINSAIEEISNCSDELRHKYILDYYFKKVVKELSVLGITRIFKFNSIKKAFDDIVIENKISDCYATYILNVLLDLDKE